MESNTSSATLFSGIQSQQRPDESTESYLERLSKVIIEARNERNYQLMRDADFIAPTFRAYVDLQPAVDDISLEDHIASHQKMVTEYPHHYIFVNDAFTFIDYKGGTGSVFIDKRLHGHPPGVVLHGLSVFVWQKFQDRWLCIRSFGMRGMGAMSSTKADDLLPDRD